MKVTVDIDNWLLREHFGIKKGDIVTAKSEFKGRIYADKDGYLCRTEQGKEVVIYKSECSPAYN